METTTLVEIAEEHTDELNHLNHVEAVRLFELAREDWYEACGLYIGNPEGVFPLSAVVVNINYNYRLECFLGEKIKVMTRPVSMGTKSFTLDHTIIKPNGEIAIDGNATSVIMDAVERTIIPVPECMARHLPAR